MIEINSKQLLQSVFLSASSESDNTRYTFSNGRLEMKDTEGPVAWKPKENTLNEYFQVNIIC